jgi:hypothetical protein
VASGAWLALALAVVVREHAGEAPVLLRDLLDDDVGVLGPLVSTRTRTSVNSRTIASFCARVAPLVICRLT